MLLLCDCVAVLPELLVLYLAPLHFINNTLFNTYATIYMTYCIEEEDQEVNPIERSPN